MKPAGTPLEVFIRLLEESAAALTSGDGLQIPEDELHREILVPLLPAMLGDKAIRQHWREQTATGFLARLTAHLEASAPAPHWIAGDFEIHVTASYLAGPDAKALADTLLSEESLRDLAAALMNQTLGVIWPKLPTAEAIVEAVAPTPAAPAAEPIPELAVPEVAEVLPETSAPVEPTIDVPAVVAPAIEELEQTAAAEEPALVPAAEAPSIDEPDASTVAPIASPSAIPSVEPAPRGIVFRRGKPNPLRGIHHSFGGLADRGWLARNPLKRRRLG